MYQWTQDCSDVATSQGIWAATRSWKRQEMDSSVQPPEKAGPCQNLILAQ